MPTSQEDRCNKGKSWNWKYQDLKIPNLKFGEKISLVSKTELGTLNNTYLNNFQIFNKVFKKTKIKGIDDKCFLYAMAPTLDNLPYNNVNIGVTYTIACMYSGSISESINIDHAST